MQLGVDKPDNKSQGLIRWMFVSLKWKETLGVYLMTRFGKNGQLLLIIVLGQVQVRLYLHWQWHWQCVQCFIFHLAEVFSVLLLNFILSHFLQRGTVIYSYHSFKIFSITRTNRIIICNCSSTSLTLKYTPILDAYNFSFLTSHEDFYKMGSPPIKYVG